MKKIYLFISLVFSIVSFSQAPGGSCATIASFCGDASVPFNNVTNTPNLGNIGCLGTSPNGAWYSFQVSNPGLLEFEISQTNAAGVGIDVDFICWGPFSTDPRANSSLCTTTLEDYPNGSNLGANNIVACSYSAAPVENFSITGAVAGDYYVVLITNFSNQSGTITFDQTNNTGGSNGSTNCEICGVTLGPDRFICNSSVTSVTLTADFYSPPVTAITLNYRWYLNGVLQTTTTTNSLVVTQNGLWRVEVDRVACTPTEYDEIIVEISSGIASNIIGPYSGAVGDCNPSFDLTSYLSDLMTPSNPANYTYEFYDENGILIPDPTNFTPTATTIIFIRIIQGTCDDFVGPFDILVDCIPPTCSLTLDSPASTSSQSVCINDAITDIVYSPGGSATGIVLSSGSFPTGVTGSFASGVYTITGTPTQLGTFNYTVETVGCTTNLQLSGTITVNALPTLTSLSSNSPICYGEDAIFYFVGTANSTVSYTLNGGSTVLTVLLDASGNGSVTIAGATTNNLINLSNIAVGSCNSTLSNSETVVIQAQPNAGTNGTLTVCAGTTPTNAELFAQLGGTPDTSGTWSNSGLVYTYTVAATAPCTVNATATVTVTEQAQPNAGTNGTLTVCAGTTPTNAELFAQLGGTPDTTGTWTNSGLVYTYTVNAIAPCTGSATATVTVTEQVVTASFSTGNSTACSGSSIVLNFTGTPNSTVYFTDGTNNYNVVLDATGTYNYNSAPLSTSVTYTLTNVVSASPYNCSQAINQNLNITISPRPTVTFVNNSPSICSGSSTDIVLTSNVSGATFSWNAVGTNVNGSSNGSGTSINQTLTTTSDLVGEVVYTVVATANGCSGAPVEVRVNINPIPDVIVTPLSETICSGTSTNISFSGSISGTVFNWTVVQSGVTGATSGTGTSIQQVLNTTSLTTSGTAVYTITPVLNGCSGASVDVTVTVNPTPEILGSPTHLPICSGEFTNINVSAMDPLTTFDFTVNAVGVSGATGGTIVGNDIIQQLETISNSQGYVDYTITPTLNGCSGTPIVIRVYVNPLPLPVLEDGAICVDSSGNTFQTYYFHTGLSNATHTFVWYYEGNIIAGATSTSYEASLAGNYSVVATNISTGCSSEEVFGTVLETNPATGFTYTVTNAFTDNATIVISVPDGNGSIMYQIDDEELQSSNIFTGVSAGVHLITVVDTQGCTYLTEEVTVIDYPKYFTPNGDGINDYWNVIGLQNQPGAKLYIFDRYGKLIKQISTAGQGWDGTFNGQQLPSTDYWFTIEFDEGGQQKEFRAHFSLIR